MEKRKILKITHEEIKMEELKKGDLFRIIPANEKDKVNIDANDTYVAGDDGFMADNSNGEYVGTVACEVKDFNGGIV